jgi:uncharacterized membrane protein
MSKNSPAKKHGPSIEMSYEGPLPPSSELQQYEQIAPGAAQAIIQNFLAESQHRREMEQKEQNLDAHFLDRTLKAHTQGLRLALCSVILILGAGALFMLQGYPVEGASIIGSVIVGIAACFIYGSRGIKKQRS